MLLGNSLTYKCCWKCDVKYRLSMTTVIIDSVEDENRDQSCSHCTTVVLAHLWQIQG